MPSPSPSTKHIPKGEEQRALVREAVPITPTHRAHMGTDLGCRSRNLGFLLCCGIFMTSFYFLWVSVSPSVELSKVWGSPRTSSIRFFEFLSLCIPTPHPPRPKTLPAVNKSWPCSRPLCCTLDAQFPLHPSLMSSKALGCG